MVSSWLSSENVLWYSDEMSLKDQAVEKEEKVWESSQQMPAEQLKRVWKKEFRRRVCHVQISVELT